MGWIFPNTWLWSDTLETCNYKNIWCVFITYPISYRCTLLSIVNAMFSDVGSLTAVRIGISRHTILYPNIYNSCTVVLGNRYRITNHDNELFGLHELWPMAHLTGDLLIYMDYQENFVCVVSVVYVAVTKRMLVIDWLMLPWSLVVASDDGRWRSMIADSEMRCGRRQGESILIYRYLCVVSGRCRCKM